MSFLQDLKHTKGIPDFLKSANKTPENTAAAFDDGTRIIRIESRKQFFQEAFATGATNLSNERAAAFDHYSMRKGKDRVALIEVDTSLRTATLMDGSKLGEVSSEDMDKIIEFANKLNVRLVGLGTSPKPNEAFNSYERMDRSLSI